MPLPFQASSSFDESSASVRTTTSSSSTASPTNSPLSLLRPKKECRRIEFLFPKDVPGLRDYDTKAFDKEASIVITELADCAAVGRKK
jgi:hypothetical protein